MPTPHINAKENDFAKVVLMPGDPLRAKWIAENFLHDYRQITNVRGILGYTGYTKNNKKISVMASGMGIPSIGIYSYELFKEYDVENIIRIGTCGAYSKECQVNDIILVNYSCSDSNYAKIMDRYELNYIEASLDLNKIILDTAGHLNLKIHTGNIFSSDVFYEKNDSSKWREENFKALGVEMESFALFNNARVFNKKASCLLTVSDTFYNSEKLNAKEREQKLDNMILIALESSLKI